MIPSRMYLQVHESGLADDCALLGIRLAFPSHLGMLRDYATVFLISFVIGNNTRFSLVMAPSIDVLYTCACLDA